MTGVSWHSGCPVGLGQLRLLTLTHWGFDGEVHRAGQVVDAFAAVGWGGAATGPGRATTSTSQRPATDWPNCIKFPGREA